MSTAGSPLKRERDDTGAASSEDDYFTPASSASPAPISKKSKSPPHPSDGSTLSDSATNHDTSGNDNSLNRIEQLEAIFKNLRLRRIVKENHASEVNQIAFCLDPQHNNTLFGLDFVKSYDRRGAVLRDPGDNSNILGTTGGPQANIYDNEHCGDHLDIMSHFLLEPITVDGVEELPEMLTCCWVHQPQDAILACAGTDKMIHVTSLARSKELVRLSGHSHTITDIQAHPTKDEFLLSASKDGTVRMWNILTGKCIAIFEIKASVVCFDPTSDGRTFLTGGYNGEIREWRVPEEIVEMQNPEGNTIVIPVTENRVLQQNLHTARIDCIRFAKGKVLSKSVNGKVEYWDPKTLEHIRSFTIKNTASNQCRIDVRYLEAAFHCYYYSAFALLAEPYGVCILSLEV
ncbi:hypothetical protein BGW38_000690 [Lunasporangiospora selenospora]|uniref:Uncharacterized protein n=1 Tax=Lunasporangiospora selenospora TaxID=979761 RepID=A0A9P6KIX7_9FUNG|nr:hypothetical protein BGW38_000690 [Lunasporangiospora selenospora]